MKPLPMPAAAPFVAAIVSVLATAAWAEAAPQTSAAAERVVVTATRHALAWVDAPAAMSVVPRSEIEARGADNVLDAVRGEAGISLQGRTIGGRKVISMRGMDSKQTLFLVDGRRIGASDGVMGHSDYQYDWIAVEDIERIEVVRGPLSALYGSEAMGGVINIITRKPGPQWGGSGSVEGAWAEHDRGGDGYRVAAQASGPLADRLRLGVGAAQTRRGAVQSAEDPQLSEIEGRDKRDGWIGLGWQPLDGQQVDLEYRAGHEERWADARERGGARRYHETVNDIERRLWSAAWQSQWGRWGDVDGVETQLRAYGSAIDVDNRRSNGVTPNVPQRIEDEVLEGQAYGLLGGHGLTAGFEARNEALRDPGMPGGESKAQHRALFGQDEFAFAERWAATLGLRWDHHELYGAQWSPRAYLVHRFGDGWAAKGGYAHGFKAPNLKQIVPGARQEGPNLFYGNPDLQPETSDSFELGVGRARGAQEFQLMGFDNHVDDLIEVEQLAPGPVPGTGVYTYANVAKARLRGVELALAQPLGERFTARLAYTYLDARDGDGERLERRPRHSASAGLDAQAGSWRAGLRADYSADQVQGGQTLPELTLWYAHLVWTARPGVDLTLGIDNLTDVRLADESPQFLYAEPPRTLRLGLRASF